MLSKSVCPFSAVCILLCCILVSCSGKRIGNPRLLRADTLMELLPDSSYSILRSLSPDGLSRSEQMSYALLMAEATDKKLLSLLPCDSLLDEAIRYYGKGVNRAKALLYKGRILAKMKMYGEAMQCCFDALKELSGTDESELKIRGILYEDLGNLYLEQSLFDEAMEAFDKAEKNFVNCGYTLGVSSVLCNMGRYYLLKDDSVCARRYMKQSILPVRCLRDSVAVSAVFHNLSCTYDDMDSVLFYAKQALDLDKKTSMKSAIMAGYAYLNKGMADSAGYYFGQALTDTVIETRALAYYGLKDLMETMGDNRRALDYFNNYSALMDSIYFFRESSELERKSYEYMAEFRFYKDRIKIKAWSVGICMTVLILSSCIILRILCRRRMRRLQYERDGAALQAAVSDLQYRIAILRHRHEKDRELLSRKESELRNISDEKAKLRNTVFMETQIYKKIKALGAQKKGKRKEDFQVLLSEEQIQLRTVVKRVYKDYISGLKRNYPQYTEDDCIFACLSLLDLDDFTIALCFGNFDTRIVVQRRYRMKKKAERGAQD